MRMEPIVTQYSSSLQQQMMNKENNHFNLLSMMIPESYTLHQLNRLAYINSYNRAYLDILNRKKILEHATWNLNRMVAPNQILSSAAIPVLPNQILSANILPPTKVLSVAAPSTATTTKSGLDVLGSVAAIECTTSTAVPRQPEQRQQEKIVISRTAKDFDRKECIRDGIVYFEKLRDSDVLCGRGGRSNHHPGNKRYRQVISDMKNTYRSTEKKLKKTDLSRTIVDYVHSYGGRFVKKDAASGTYIALTRSEARKKTSQALREQKKIKWTA